jgi:hypothetical protein
MRRVRPFQARWQSTKEPVLGEAAENIETTGSKVANRIRLTSPISAQSRNWPTRFSKTRRYRSFGQQCPHRDLISRSSMRPIRNCSTEWRSTFLGSSRICQHVIAMMLKASGGAHCECVGRNWYKSRDRLASNGQALVARLNRNGNIAKVAETLLQTLRLRRSVKRTVRESRENYDLRSRPIRTPPFW